MKIVYVAMSNSRISGVERKILNQYEVMKKKCEAYLYLLFNDFPEREYFDFLYSKKINFILPQKRKNIFRNRYEKLISTAFEIKEKFDFNDTILYVRYPISDGIFLKFCNILSKYIIVTEHQIKENAYISGGKLQIRLLPEIFYGNVVRKKIDRFVGVTKEITEFQKSKCPKNKNFHGITIGNGINAELIKVRQYEYKDESTNVLFVGTPYPSHGLDRFLKSLYLYRKLEGGKSIIFHVVGESKYISEYKKMAEKLELQNIVRFYGHKSGRDLEYLYNICDLALGSIALHRKKLKETSELKAREYCAKGIPFICSSADNDFPTSFKYRLLVPSGDGPIDLKKILDFKYEVCTIKNHPMEMHYYALEKLDWNEKIKSLIQFLRT